MSRVDRPAISAMPSTAVICPVVAENAAASVGRKNGTHRTPKLLTVFDAVSVASWARETLRLLAGRAGGTGRRYPRTTTSASISTGMRNGRLAIPTALRAWAPTSGPNTSRIRSLNPLITAG